jgi:solute carrier family 45 protein 1/2/4
MSSPLSRHIPYASLSCNSRTSSKTNGWGAVKSIWTNIFLLPPAIASICYAQFFAWIGWFPILFYTSVWVGEIYTREVIAGGRSEDDPDLAADATRAGSRALFLNACVNLFTSIFLPFLVSSSGIKAPTAEQTLRMSSSSPARTHVEGFLGRILLQLDRVRSLIPFPKRFRFQIPLPWLTLIRTWAIGQFMFCFTMMATW